MHPQLTAQWQALIDENAVLARGLAGAQQRSMRQAAEFARQADAADARLLRTRAELLACQTLLQQAQERLAELEANAPEPALRREPAPRGSLQAPRAQDLQRALLAAADLVLCQVGCLSHDACWRVKDHCKRTGKRCVFVQTPSRSAWQRALAQAANGLACTTDQALPDDAA